MNGGSPAAAYFTIHNLFWTVRKLKSIDAYVEWTKNINAALDMCYERLSAVAHLPDPEIWFALGDAFGSGRGTARDDTKAIEFFRRAADAGDTRAMVRLGYCFWRPDSPEFETGMQWFRRAAEAGDPSGMVKLGFCYRDGNGVPCDAKEAVQWFVRAADAGHCHAIMLAGRVYSYDLDSPKEAVHWFERAASAGLHESFIELALLHENRKSGVYDPVKAVKWYELAAEHRFSATRAMFALAQLCRNGVGVPQSQKKARHWLERIRRIANEKSSDYKRATKLLKKMDGELL